MKDSHEAQIMIRDPNSTNYLEYYDYIIAHNQELHRRIGSEIENLFGNLKEDICIATTGSDARYEKGHVSLIETVLFGEQSTTTAETARMLSEHIKKPKEMKFFEQRIEIRPPNTIMSKVVFTTAQGVKSTVISPNRIFDARGLYGIEFPVIDAKYKLVTELISPFGKKVLEQIKKKTSEYKKLTVTGALS